MLLADGSPIELTTQSFNLITAALVALPLFVSAFTSLKNGRDIRSMRDSLSGTNRSMQKEITAAQQDILKANELITQLRIALAKSTGTPVDEKDFR